MGPLRNFVRTHGASMVVIAFVASVAVIAPALSRPKQSAIPAIEIAFDPSQTRIHWTLGSTLHTVHGTFKLKRGKLQFDPATGSVVGEIVADALSGESGNSGRDSKMHKEVLESARFPEIVFHPDRASGTLSVSGTATLNVHGNFLLHGAEHEMTLPVELKRDGDRWTSSSKFKIPFLAWGLKNPSNFLLKVKPDVEIELDGAGSIH